MRIGIAASRFNEDITTALVAGAVEAIVLHGGAARPEEVVWVPGAFELPLAADILAATRRYDAILCLGAVIRGETPHFEYVSAECARGIQDVMLSRKIPVAFGVLTTNTRRQALARSGGRAGNKGWDAALAAMEMIMVVRKAGRPGRKTRRS